MTSLVVCGCQAGSSCARFASETWSGQAGLAAESYKRYLWHATSGNVLGEVELAMLKMEVAAVLSMGNEGPLPSTSVAPKFGNCARVFTIRLLKYRIYQGSPYTAAALVLIPTFARAHNDFPVLPCLHGMVSKVKDGVIPNYRTNKPDLSTVWPRGRLRTGYIHDSFLFNRDEQEIWRLWAVVRAREMLGDSKAWDGWKYPFLAPVPSPARIEWPITQPDSPADLPAFTDAPIPKEDLSLLPSLHSAAAVYTVNVGDLQITVRLPKSEHLDPETSATPPHSAVKRFAPPHDEVDAADRTRDFVQSTASVSFDSPTGSGHGDDSTDGSDTSSLSSSLSVALTLSNPSTESRSAFNLDPASSTLPTWGTPLFSSSTWHMPPAPMPYTPTIDPQYGYGASPPLTMVPPSHSLPGQSATYLAPSPAHHYHQSGYYG